MKTRLILITIPFALLFLFVAGCRHTTGGEAKQPVEMTRTTVIIQKPVTTTESFFALYKQWTSRLEGIAAKTESAYVDLNSQKINLSEFNTQIDQIDQEMKALNLETDVKADFELSDKDKQSVNYQAVTNAYQQTSKSLSDFLYYAPHLKGDQLKSKHDELIQNKYQTNITELKRLLNI